MELPVIHPREVDITSIDASSFKESVSSTLFDSDLASARPAEVTTSAKSTEDNYTLPSSTPDLVRTKPARGWQVRARRPVLALWSVLQSTALTVGQFVCITRVRICDRVRPTGAMVGSFVKESPGAIGRSIHTVGSGTKAVVWSGFIIPFFFIVALAGTISFWARQWVPGLFMIGISVFGIIGGLILASRRDGREDQERFTRGQGP